jgi:hypothetical protein
MTGARCPLGMRLVGFGVFVLGAGGCGDGGDGSGTPCDVPLEFEVGHDGHSNPLGAGPDEARAGRLGADDLPVDPRGLATYAAGDFVLANDRIAMIIEDVGASDLYDPWGGRPVGVTLVDGGRLVAPADFGEMFLLTGRETVVTQNVSVINDGSDGNAAVVRASGPLAPLPFFDSLSSVLLSWEHADIPSAIEYVLEPGADYVDIFYLHNSARLVDVELPFLMHAFLYEPRMPVFTPGAGFVGNRGDVPFLAFADQDAASWSYSRLEEDLKPGVSASGFTSNLVGSAVIAACSQTRRHHARITIGGPGVNGLLRAVARSNGGGLRTLTGVVRDADGAPALGVRVHAESPGQGYLSRTLTGADGSYALHVQDGLALELTAYRRGDAIVGPVAVAADQATADLTLAPTGILEVVAIDTNGRAIPARMQILPADGAPRSLPAHFGEDLPRANRFDIRYSTSGVERFRVPAGTWQVVVSRGFEYEIDAQVVSVAAGQVIPVQGMLERVVDTTGVMCADYHIHTIRSADSGDDAALKIQSAVADGLEIPVRSEHEYVDSFQPLIDELGLERYAFGVGSVELTSMEVWGHVGVFPLAPDPTMVNGGAPVWQEFPTTEDVSIPLRTLEPPEVFAAARARPEEPIIIINHPRGGNNYFEYVGLDRMTGLPAYAGGWDEEFGVVEVFNGSGWHANLAGTVADWFALLNSGRRVFAVGSSDSHGIASTPVGYPRTCLALGSDDPQTLNDELVRDVTAAGQATIVGGIFLDVRVGAVGPGGEVAGVGPTATVTVTVQAPSWIDVDALDVVVDGVIIQTIAITAADADPANPAVRYRGDLQVPVSDGSLGSYVIMAAYGDEPMDLVHPGRMPFAVSNPIFLMR